ncbi:MAG TPA: acetate/propionate family kinase [Gammaproteobacteria bacterium]
MNSGGAAQFDFRRGGSAPSVRWFRPGQPVRLLAVNTGSASVKLDAVEYDGRRLRHVHAGRYDSTQCDPDALLQDFLSLIEPPQAVVHRVVHGGDVLVESRIVDAATESAIDALGTLAPLHNPIALRWIRACRRLLDVDQIAVFDTAFFRDLPPVARSYAIPERLSAQLGIRRYGFHGIAHQAMWRRWCRLRPDLPDGGRLISIQLGGGCSIAAIRNGAPQDISMGFTPLEGLMMATRSGDLDPGAVLRLLKRHPGAPEAVERLLNEQSGLLGVSENSADMRVLIDAEDARSHFAVELYCYRIRKYIGAYMAVLGGADGIVFGGGVGEHSPPIRAAALENLHWCGILPDAEANRGALGAEARIGSAASRVDLRVVHVDETAILAAEAYAVMRGRASVSA